MRKYAALFLCFSVLLPMTVTAGSLDSSGAPSAGSNMPTMTDIYNQLDTGTTSAPATSFQEPVSGPTAGTGKTLSDIKAKLPSPDNTNGATTADVLSGKTFWGLRTDGTWGPQTGNNANIADTGSGDATAADIKNGKKAWVDGSEVTGILYGGYICATGDLSPLGRWCDNHNGTVRDMTTGLIWLKDAGWAGRYPLYAATQNGANAQDVAAKTKAGNPVSLTDGSVYGGWRLPTKSELASIVTGTEYIRNTAMYKFINVQNNIYWSSTANETDTLYGWYVDMSNGYVGSNNAKNGDGYVWPVRAGQ